MLPCGAVLTVWVIVPMLRRIDTPKSFPMLFLTASHPSSIMIIEARSARAFKYDIFALDAITTVVLLSDVRSNHPEPPSEVTRSEHGGRTDDKATICTYDKVTTGPLYLGALLNGDSKKVWRKDGLEWSNYSKLNSMLMFLTRCRFRRWTDYFRYLC
jgi:hypothetical protein